MYPKKISEESPKGVAKLTCHSTNPLRCKPSRFSRLELALRTCIVQGKHQGKRAEMTKSRRNPNSTSLWKDIFCHELGSPGWLVRIMLAMTILVIRTPPHRWTPLKLKLPNQELQLATIIMSSLSCTSSSHKCKPQLLLQQRFHYHMKRTTQTNNAKPQTPEALNPKLATSSR